MKLPCCPLPLRSRRRQPGCATCLIPNQVSGASVLAAAFVTVALMGGPYATPQCCAVLRLLLSRQPGLTSGSVSSQTGTCRPQDATPEAESNTGIIRAGVPCVMLLNPTGCWPLVKPCHSFVCALSRIWPVLACPAQRYWPPWCGS